MSIKLLESGLIEHCAPTLAGIKTGSLFNHSFKNKQSVLKDLETINELLNPRGVYLEALCFKENSVLIYAYRPKYLQSDLERPGAMDLLYKYGYTDSNVQSCIDQLKRRLYHYDCFPHEIGIFLGYPLEDVKGFIENNGRNCKTCGMWKVYCNEGDKEKLFKRYKKCQNVYIQVFGKGKNLTQMTVST